ncbi:MAG: hypothetical protein ACI9U2_002299 [Bradymonadia bacterium]|jgi:hypothetical protein
MSAEGTHSILASVQKLAQITDRRSMSAASRTPDARRIQRMARASSEALRVLPERLFGIALGPVLNGATRVRPAPLSNDDKVRVFDGEVRVEQRCFDCIARTAKTDDQAQTEAAMYVLHELAHIPQGIGDYAVVKALRTINEEDILDLDLAADHFAALAIARMDGPLGLIDLKNMQGRSLCSYPVGGVHSRAARLRKARRVVSLRADVLLRGAGMIRPDAGYLVAAFANTSADLALFERGCGAARLVDRSVLDAKDMLSLAAAADPAEDDQAAIARVDAVLERAFSGHRYAA